MGNFSPVKNIEHMFVVFPNGHWSNSSLQLGKNAILLSSCVVLPICSMFNGHRWDKVGITHEGQMHGCVLK